MWRWTLGLIRDEILALYNTAPWCIWLSHQSNTLKALSSIPGGVSFYLVINTLKALGSIPGGVCFYYGAAW